MILLVALLLQTVDPVPLEQGRAAPFDGVLVPPERIAELIRAEAERDALLVRVAEEVRIRDAWAALAKQAAVEPAPTPEAEWLDDPELNRWAGFFAGVLVAGAAVVGGAWVSGLASDAGGS